MKVIFVVGKGGVGKTTCAAAVAFSVSKGHNTLIVSLDPAHNLGDVFATPLSGKAVKVKENLAGLEVDMEGAIRSYLEQSSRKLKDMYGYLKAINIEGYLDTIRLSPGIEEYATLEAMQRIISEHEGKSEIIVFDTPPTGLTLRVLALPKVSLIWGERLVKLRKEILSKRTR
jgi:arsenite-transporting ATPase